MQDCGALTSFTCTYLSHTAGTALSISRKIIDVTLRHAYNT